MGWKAYGAVQYHRGLTIWVTTISHLCTKFMPILSHFVLLFLLMNVYAVVSNGSRHDGHTPQNQTSPASCCRSFPVPEKVPWIQLCGVMDGDSLSIGVPSWGIAERVANWCHCDRCGGRPVFGGWKLVFACDKRGQFGYDNSKWSSTVVSWWSSSSSPIFFTATASNFWPFILSRIFAPSFIWPIPIPYRMPLGRDGLEFYRFMQERRSSRLGDCRRCNPNPIKPPIHHHDQHLLNPAIQVDNACVLKTLSGSVLLTDGQTLISAEVDV